MLVLMKIMEIIFRLLCAAAGGTLAYLIPANDQAVVIAMTIVGAAAGYLAADIWIIAKNES